MILGKFKNDSTEYSHNVIYFKYTENLFLTQLLLSYIQNILRECVMYKDKSNIVFDSNQHLTTN